MRTPRARILGWAEQLEQDALLPDSSRQKATGIRTQCEKLRTLIEDVYKRQGKATHPQHDNAGDEQAESKVVPMVGFLQFCTESCHLTPPPRWSGSG